MIRYRKFFALCLASFFFLCVFTTLLTIQHNASALNWYNVSWSYSKKITIDHTKIPATLHNFPVLFDNTSSSFAHAQADGDDFFFTSSDNLTKFAHQIESFSGNRLISWVNVTTVSSVSDTVIYLYYGNSTCSSQQNPTGVWDSNYKAVYHSTINAGGLIDSTSNANTGALIGTGATTIAGIVFNAIDYTGVTTTGGYYILPNLYGVNQSAISIDVWIKPDTITSDDGVFSRASAIQQPLLAIYSSAWSFGLNVGGSVYAGAGAVVISVWTHLVMTYSDVDDTVRYFANGVQIDTDVTGGGNARTDYGFWIAMYAGTTHKFDGKIDEIRFSNTQRNVSWINASYRNQNAPNTFITVAAEFLGHITPIAPSYFEARTQNTSKINLNWTKGTGTDKTIIVANSSDYKAIGVGTILYNGTGVFFNHTGLSQNTHWFYRAYSWNSSGVGTLSISYLRSHDTTMGGITGLVLIENIVNASGFHNYSYSPLTGDNGEWWVWANYTGTGGGSNIFIAGEDHRILYLSIGGTLGCVLTFICGVYLFKRKRGE